MNGRLTYDDRIPGITAFELTIPREPAGALPTEATSVVTADVMPRTDEAVVRR